MQRSLLRSVVLPGSAFHNRPWNRRSIPESESCPKASAIAYSRKGYGETLTLGPLPKMHQAYDSPLGEAIPNTPLRAVDLSQRMTALRTISSRAYAFRKLLEIRKSHRNVEPVQYMVSMWRNLVVDRAQTSIAVGKNCDRSGFIDSTLPQRKTDRAYRLGTSAAHESKACGMPIAIQRLA